MVVQKSQKPSWYRVQVVNGKRWHTAGSAARFCGVNLSTPREWKTHCIWLGRGVETIELPGYRGRLFDHFLEKDLAEIKRKMQAAGGSQRYSLTKAWKDQEIKTSGGKRLLAPGRASRLCKVTADTMRNWKTSCPWRDGAGISTVPLPGPCGKTIDYYPEDELLEIRAEMAKRRAVPDHAERVYIEEAAKEASISMRTLRRRLKAVGARVVKERGKSVLAGQGQGPRVKPTRRAFITTKALDALRAHAQETPLPPGKVTRKEAAKILGLTEGWVWRLVEQGVLTAEKGTIRSNCGYDMEGLLFSRQQVEQIRDQRRARHGKEARYAKLERAKAALTELLSGGPRPCSAIFKAMYAQGHPREYVYKAKKALRVKETRIEEGFYQWQLRSRRAQPVNTTSPEMPVFIPTQIAGGINTERSLDPIDRSDLVNPPGMKMSDVGTHRRLDHLCELISGMHPLPDAPELPASVEEKKNRIEQPAVYLWNWQEILVAVGMVNDRENQVRLREANKESCGPIIFPGGRGSQPKADRNELIAWFNGLKQRWIEQASAIEARQADRNGTVQEQHGYGRSGIVAPEIGGEIKKRRTKNPMTKNDQR